MEGMTHNNSLRGGGKGQSLRGKEMGTEPKGGRGTEPKGGKGDRA